jgi:hypothetical protein
MVLPVYPDGCCDCNNGTLGCDGVCNSGMVVDECGVCGGLGISKKHCNCEGWTTNCNGVCTPDEDHYDECGVCNGPGIVAPFCDCEGNVRDECGVCNGAGIDVAGGFCSCDLKRPDCNGECGGTVGVDEC